MATTSARHDCACPVGSLRPAQSSREENGLPLGLAQGMKLKRAIRAHQRLRWDDVAYDETAPAIAFRLEMEKAFAPPVIEAR